MVIKFYKDGGIFMSDNNKLVEISTSLAAESLTLFLGTGFSKYMTDGSAPSWLELLYECALQLEDDHIIHTLFYVEEETVQQCNVNLTICAQILEDEFFNRGKNIRNTVSDVIKDKINLNTLNKNRVKHFRDFLLKHENINIVTTNYDSIITDFILPMKSKVIVDGDLIHKSKDIVPIYHIHGAITSPDSIILTEADYFRFLHKENYMSRKFYTLIQDTTLVILGYSLNDFNLNRVLNEARELKINSIRESDIYYVSRNEVQDIYQRYFYSTFGVSVLQNLDIDTFFKSIDSGYESANKLLSTLESFSLALEGKQNYKDEFLKLKQSFSYILLSADVSAHSFNDKILQSFILHILNKKEELTRISQAWEQYEHLADWLALLGSRFEMKDTELEDGYLKLVEYSFKKMSKDQSLGYSWQAHFVWKNNFIYLMPGNKELIHEMVSRNLDKFERKNGIDQILQIPD